MWECCADGCAGGDCRHNQVVAGGIQLPLEVFKSRNKGWGVHVAREWLAWGR